VRIRPSGMACVASRVTRKPRTDREGEGKKSESERRSREVKSPISIRRSSREAIETYITLREKGSTAASGRRETHGPMTQGKKRV
jgi:hypothetical protein